MMYDISKVLISKYKDVACSEVAQYMIDDI